MLRFIVLVLLLCNGAYFAWTQGLLQGLGFGPAVQTEPQRIGQQIKPEAIQVLSEQDLKREDAAMRTAAKPVVCLQSGLLDEEQSTVLSRVVASVLPAGSWTLDAVVEPARWIVYMGKYASEESLTKKRAELASLNLKFEPLINPALGLGLSLGGFETQAAANSALEALSRRGVRTARVVQERAQAQGKVLKVPAVDDALRTRLEDLKPALAGKTLSPCR